MRVMVIGGGIGGLCLARGLIRSGLSVAVYERDSSVRSRSQGYRIGTNSDGVHALRECLPSNLFDLFLASANKPIEQAVIATFDDQLNEMSSIAVPHSPGSGRINIGVNRLTLREILAAGLESQVHFGKELLRFEHMDGSVVRAFFGDGTSADGELLVGADGTHSVVREALISGARVVEVGRAIYGKTPIRPKLLQELPDSVVKGMTRISAANGISMAIGPYQKVKPFDQAIKEYAPGVRITPTSDYLMWTLSARGSKRPISDEQLDAADAAGLHAVALELTREWHPALRRVTDLAQIAATFLVHLRSAEPVGPWQTTNVTLLGDAIHTMTPGRGLGANTALRDAELLTRTLGEVAAQRSPLIPKLADYEREMIRYGFEAVADSLNRPLLGIRPQQRRA